MLKLSALRGDLTSFGLPAAGLVPLPWKKDRSPETKRQALSESAAQELQIYPFCGAFVAPNNPQCFIRV